MQPMLLLIAAALGSAAVLARKVTFVNECGYDVWPAIAGLPDRNAYLGPRGWAQPRGSQLVTRDLTNGWEGRIWGRRACSFDAASGKGSCASGDCNVRLASYLLAINDT